MAGEPCSGCLSGHCPPESLWVALHPRLNKGTQLTGTTGRWVTSAKGIIVEDIWVGLRDEV